ncbi:MAG: amidohydrolase family protein [Planctomycetota bacterium]
MKKIDIHLHPLKNDPGLDKYVKAMDKGDVAAGLVHGLPDAWEGDSKFNANEATRKACERHPGRLYGSVCVDFRQPAAEVIAVVRDYASAGFKSIKLFPNIGYHPSDPQYDRIWDTVEDLGLLCLSHCGWLGGTAPAMRDVDQLTARPFCFERAARNHPGINFIMAHFGGGAYYLETCVLTLRLKNFYADTCPGWGRWVFEQRLPGLTGLDFTKIMYGTDGAGAWDIDGYKHDENFWTATHKAMGRGPEDLERYYYGNAARLLKIATKDTKSTKVGGVKKGKKK